MQTVPCGWWHWRMIQALGRNPLVRMTDRVETLVIAMAVTASLIAIPVAGAMATAIHEERGRAYVAEAQHRQSADATVTATSPTLRGTDVSVVQANWQYAGVHRTERFRWESPVKVGQTIEISVYPDGRRAPPLDPWWRAGVDASIAAVSFWLAVTAVAAMFVGVARPCLRRMRYAAWDREIASLADGGTANRR
ncbi:Rv1733c family protein [Mycolicibacterium celeriflavum]|uniref:Rv1733c family protein n=1 Tax=Mycolicibacterium celeriflavum TaxID=1249101 RepID=UPI003CEEB4F5